MEATAPNREPEAWLPSADGLRATAAVLLFLHHASFLTAATSESRAGAILARLDVGIAVFFALSGFLLARPYLAAIFDGTPLPDLRTFYKRRALRIIPAYWVALTLTYVWIRPETATGAEGLDFPLHYLLLQIYPGDTAANGISAAWTLAVAVSFYAVLPLLAVGAAKLVAPLAGVSRKAVGLLGALGLLTVLSLLYRSVIYAVDGPLQAPRWLPGTLGEFAIGIAAAVLVTWTARRDVARPLAGALGRHDLLWWALAAASIAFSASQLGLARGPDPASWNRELYGELTRMATAAFVLLPVAFGAQDRGVVRWLLRSWPARSLGTIAYGFFLFHVPFIELAIELTGREVFLDWSEGLGLVSSDVLLPVGLAFLFSVAAGTASWFLLEKPLLGNRRRRATPAATSVAEPTGERQPVEVAP